MSSDHFTPVGWIIFTPFGWIFTGGWGTTQLYIGIIIIKPPYQSTSILDGMSWSHCQGLVFFCFYVFQMAFCWFSCYLIWWFGARWLGILGIPIRNNPFRKRILSESKAPTPNHQLVTLVDSLTYSNPKHNKALWISSYEKFQESNATNLPITQVSQVTRTWQW